MPKPIYYTKNRLLRKPELFSDPQWVDGRLHDRNTKIIPIWRNRNLILGHDSPAAITLSGDHARGLLEIASQIALLGVDADEDNRQGDSAIFAVDVSQHELPDLSPMMGTAEFVDLRQVGVLMDAHEGSLLSHARGLMYWHRHNCFCSECGSPTSAEEAGRVRRCNNELCERIHFPRTDPAVIMLVTRPGPDGGACLLGRHENFSTGMYSTLAGFVDQGETLEQAVAREVFEEAGILVDNVTYRASQPWPFPASLMLGFRARALTFNIDTNSDELEEARWFTRDQIARFPDKGLRLSRKDSISYNLIKDWLDEKV
ncbi:MAG: NAD(+) diphosphatase [Rhodospirillaceae bacterium]|jgi:NAD+ diphosphatase|nr:NAD(+) diphosphatase [Rhodospirillaceae bacterium]MBT5244926.1 NAD(+) diphosphatase [Rhodospirillaceae bacterium]MBT5562683.1 NAD(+) diphosphatase [Rhodospirillaceae bacterium]MBT6243007.1 NAD(+) diphosphatase [Rhodospirillaceae bacterium]MBT7136854.1 NAD(+) diphosphatase [Rhodospirillaceae bacterium]